MQLRAFKIFNRATHSFLVVFETEATGTEDPFIFVVKDRPDQVGIGIQVEESSSSESESSSSVVEEESSLLEEAESSSSVSESSESEEEESSAVPVDPRPFEIFPHRVLVSIASLTDLLVLPLVAPLGELYRASTVALLFRSKRHMEKTSAEIIAEVTINAKLQNVPIQNVDTIQLDDFFHGPDITQLYDFL